MTWLLLQVIERNRDVATVTRDDRSLEYAESAGAM
jgi:hypothetical protein